MSNQSFIKLIDRIFSLSSFIFLIAISLFFFGIYRVNTAINHIDKFDDYIVYHYGNVGILYLYFGFLMLIYLLISSILKEK